jgi:hypothetical protein
MTFWHAPYDAPWHVWLTLSHPYSVTPPVTSAVVRCAQDCLMALCLVMMVPYSSLDSEASFATAFTQVGLPWGQYLVALGAVLG